MSLRSTCQVRQILIFKRPQYTESLNSLQIHAPKWSGNLSQKSEGVLHLEYDVQQACLGAMVRCPDLSTFNHVTYFFFLQYCNNIIVTGRLLFVFYIKAQINSLLEFFYP